MCNQLSRGRVLVGVLALGIAVAPLVATPLKAQAKVGGSIGVEADNKEDFLVITGEARMAMSKRPLELVPRVSFYPREGGSVLQVDGNIVWNLELVQTKRVVPYMGAGILVNHATYDAGPGASISETKVGVNLMSGLRFSPQNSVQPYVNAAYSLVTEFPNPFVYSVGVLFQLGGRR